MFDNTTFQPVFVVGSARSGTTMMAKLLATNDEYCEYRAETLIMSVCKKRYGDIFTSGRLRENFVNDWFKSRQFMRSNLVQAEFLAVLSNSDSYASLLVNFLNAMASKSNARYIVDSTPANIDHIDDILAVCPNAKFIWMVRDGRDVALSQEKLGWVNPPKPFTSRVDKLNYSLLNWTVINQQYQNYMQHQNVLVMRYEDFVQEPETRLQDIASFLGTPASSYDLTSTVNPTTANSAFGALEGDAKSAMARWKTTDPELLNAFIVGAQKTLQLFEYEIPESVTKRQHSFRSSVFMFHIRLKRNLSSIHALSKHTSESLEFKP